MFGSSKNRFGSAKKPASTTFANYLTKYRNRCRCCRGQPGDLPLACRTSSARILWCGNSAAKNNLLALCMSHGRARRGGPGQGGQNWDKMHRKGQRISNPSTQLTQRSKFAIHKRVILKSSFNLALSVVVDLRFLEKIIWSLVIDTFGCKRASCKAF